MTAYILLAREVTHGSSAGNCPTTTRLGAGHGSMTGSVASEIPDLRGRVFIVTGGSSGIGYATVQHLVRRGGRVYMAARNEEKARTAIDHLEPEPGVEEVCFLKLDLSDPREARKAALEFISKERRLDVLSRAVRTRRLTKDTGKLDALYSHISPFVFTMSLLPLLEETAKHSQSDVRVVNVSSDGIMFLKRGIRFRNLDDFNDEHNGEFAPDLARYSNILFTKALQKRLNARNVPILALALNPGLVCTDGVLNDVRSQPPIISHIFTMVIRALWAAPSRGALTSVFAATAPVVRDQPQLYGGAYLQPPGKLGRAPNADARSLELAEELWDTTERLLRDIGVEIEGRTAGDPALQA
ncbi:hypothetical protein IEO21_06235 [Rhodonia placenta]|uniref:NAD(P)-binding protein n=1 Tax=Rhodonia placenta TaxID=104341 RepID=A0A8H7P0D8_9APHY|nr:hypothetical protein IEO21_06235 [Postia placenta]